MIAAVQGEGAIQSSAGRRGVPRRWCRRPVQPAAP